MRTVRDLAMAPSKLCHLALILFFLPTGAYAAALSSTPFSGWEIFRLIAALILVLLVFLALVWVFRRLQPGVAMGAASPLKIVASLPLGTRERLLLVELGKQQLLLGVTPAGITLLHTLAEPLSLATPSQPFAGWLRQALERQRSGSWQAQKEPEHPGSESSVSSSPSEESSSSAARR